VVEQKLPQFTMYEVRRPTGKLTMSMSFSLSFGSRQLSLRRYLSLAISSRCMHWTFSASQLAIEVFIS
jgi:hypothetical protein